MAHKRSMPGMPRRKADLSKRIYNSNGTRNVKAEEARDKPDKSNLGKLIKDKYVNK